MRRKPDGLTLVDLSWLLTYPQHNYVVYAVYSYSCDHRDYLDRSKPLAYPVKFPPQP